jgi:radical S-adenosyl methionine domain-containing protein 2
MLPREQMLSVVRLLAASFTKITFAGGEPTLCRWLPELIHEASRLGCLTNLVTNGSKLDAAFIAQIAGSLDFITLSIDSLDAGINQAIGRGPRAAGFSAEDYFAIAKRVRDAGITLKINTVVNRLNAGCDLSPLIHETGPARWKLLQAMTVDGQNDGAIEDMSVDSSEFDTFVLRHKRSCGNVTRIVPEPVSLIRGSYVMVDPQGRFFDSTLAYQVAGQGAPREVWADLRAATLGDVAPDLTLLLDIPVEQGLERANRRGEINRYDRLGLAFHQRIRDSFLDQAATEPGRFAVLDASAPLAAVSAAIIATCRARLGLP